MKIFKIISLATTALVLSASVNAALITQSYTSSIGGDIGVSAQTLTTSTAEENFYVAFAGFDQSLGELVSVDVSFTGDMLVRHRITVGYEATVTANMYSEINLNANIGAGNYNDNLASATFQNLGMSCSGPDGSRYCFDNIFVQSENIDLLALYQPEDFYMASVGFQLNEYTSATMLGCIGFSGCYIDADIFARGAAAYIGIYL